VLDVLAGLRARYGDHSVLMETAADFEPKPVDRVALYRRAERAVVTHGLPAASIRLSLAGVLLDEMTDPAAARSVLAAASPEVEAAGDASEREEWLGLSRRVGASPSSLTP
jgi:hypothetical protein